MTNGLQDVAMAFEPAEKGVLARPPRGRREGLISPVLWERTAISGAVMAAGTLYMFRHVIEAGRSLSEAQSVALSTLVVFMAFQAGNARSERLSLFQLSPVSNRFLLTATVAALAVHVAALYLPPTQFVLRVEPIEMATWARIVVVALSLPAVIEIHKLVRRRFPFAPR